MNATVRSFALLIVIGLAGGSMSAQTSVRIDPVTGKLHRLTAPYRQRYIPPINLANSSRFDSLIKAGNLYVSARDVVALALENNIDIEVQRYGPLLHRELLRRAESGSLLRNVGQNVAPGPTSVSLSGVSINTNGAPSGGGGAVSAGGGIITQLGPGLLSYDPNIVVFTNFQHATSPLSLTSLTGSINALIDDVKSIQTSYSQNWSTGTGATLTYASTYNRLNSLSYGTNPYTSGDLDLVVTQNLLNGFGKAVNNRNILVQKNNIKVTNLQFKQQVITTVTAALNLYWDLVSFNQDLKAKQEEVATAQQLLQNNEEQVRIGTLAEIEVTRAKSQLYTAKQDLVISETNILQQETVLKNALSRQGIATSDLADVHVIPLDTITIPAKEDLPSINDLTADALKNRLEIEQAKLNLESNNMNLVGIKNSLRPTLQVFAELTNNGLSGTSSNTAFSGGYGTLLGQIFRRDYPNYSAGVSLTIPLRNRAAQADYATSVIEIRQNELNFQKQVNQVRVDVQNAVIGMQQARVRYDASVQARMLSQQTFDADKKKYELGAGTPYQVVQDQRDLASAQSSEAQAMANYSHASIALDQALGRTLEVNHVSMDEAISGRSSAVPSVPPQEVK
jgi:outer membrane protein